MKPIKSIEEELADCRKAFAEHPDAKLVWCCHHTVLVEKLTEPFENRISYILLVKPEEERAARFRNFRPVKDEVTIAKALEDHKTAIAKALKDCNIAIAKAEEDYKTAIAKALAGCNIAIAKAEEDYKTAVAKGMEDYGAAIAKAMEDYETAIAKPWEVYDAAKAQAWEVYDAALKPAEKPLVAILSQEWPDHTWNEGSIF